MDNKKTFSNNLKYYMSLHGKSRIDVSKDIGVSYNTFTDWYNGKKYPRMDKVEMLADYFGILKSDLIEEKEEQKKGAIQKDDPDEKKKDEIRRLFAQMSPDQQETFLLEGYRIVFGRHSEDHLSHPVKHSQEDDSGDYNENH